MAYLASEKLSAHFSLGEFVRPEDLKTLPTYVYNNLKYKLCPLLETARKKLGNRSLKVTSGYRSIAKQISVYRELAASKGVPFNLSAVPLSSFHISGLAADLMVSGMSSEKARQILVDLECGMELGTVHLHLDARGYRERFYP